MGLDYSNYELIQDFNDETDSVKVNQHHYFDVMVNFFKWIKANGYDWRELGISHIIKFKDALDELNKPPTVVFYYLIIIKMFFKWRANREQCKDISNGIKLPKRKYIFPVIPTPEQLKAESKIDALGLEIDKLLSL